jgi:hypothetical protein
MDSNIVAVVGAAYTLLNAVALLTKTKKDDQVSGVIGQILRVVLPGLRFGRH